MSEHTPGPWKGDYLGRVRGITRRGEFGRIVADVRRGAIHPDEDAANQRLIVAAPAMLEALEAISQHAYDDETQVPEILFDFDAMREIALAAIREATGGDE